MRLLNLPEWLTEAGLTFVETPGWIGRGAPLADDIGGVVNHHTAGPATGDMPSLLTLIHGRPDLAGPLAQLGGGRSGTVYVVASGKANHAGGGGYATIPANEGGNSHLVGIEWENTGVGQPWSREQMATAVKLNAMLAGKLRLDPSQLIAHYEWAKPVGRKIDPAGPWVGGGDWYSGGKWQTGIRTASADQFRARVMAYMEGDDDMNDADRALLLQAAADSAWCKANLMAWFSLPGEGRPYGDLRRKQDATYVEVADEQHTTGDPTLGGRLVNVERMVAALAKPAP